MYNIIYETSHQSRFDARYWMLGAGALGRPRGMVWGGRGEEGSGWGTRVYLWRIHVDIWQNQYNIVKLKKKRKKSNKLVLFLISLIVSIPSLIFKNLKIAYDNHKSSAALFTVFQFSLVTQSCPTLCDPMNRSMPCLPVHHQLPEFTQTHVHRVSDAIQPSHPLSSPSPPAPNPSQHQSLFQ